MLHAYTKNHLLFIWNSNLTRHPIILFAKSSSHTWGCVVTPNSKSWGLEFHWIYDKLTSNKVWFHLKTYCTGRRLPGSFFYTESNFDIRILFEKFLLLYEFPHRLNKIPAVNSASWRLKHDTLKRNRSLENLHLFFCFAYRVIITIFLNSIYMH